jgi:hypothetical protein
VARALPWALAAALVGCVGSAQTDDVSLRPDTDPDPIYVGIPEVTPAALLIADAPLDQRTTGAVTLANVGAYELTLKAGTLAEDADGALTTDERTNAGRVLREGESYDILVVCRPATGDEIRGSLRIETDAQGDAGIIDVPVTCTPIADDTDG